MIARFWSARSPPAQARNYVDHLKTKVLATLRKLEGYSRAMLLERQASNEVEIVVITFWQSLESIRSFAGDDLETAIVADEAADLLTQFDRRVRQYELVVKDEV